MWGECLREAANLRETVGAVELSVPVQGGPTGKRCKGRPLIVIALVETRP